MKSRLLGTMVLFLCFGCSNGKMEEPPENPQSATTTAAPQDSIRVTRDPENPNRGWILMGSGDEFTPVPVRLENGVWVLEPQTPAEPQPSTDIMEDYKDLREQEQWRR